MLLTVNGWLVSEDSLSFPSLTLRKDNEALLGDFFNQIINQYMSEITPNASDSFEFELYSNESFKYDKLRINESIITVLSANIYYRYLFDFIDYTIDFNSIDSLEIETILSYSIDNNINIINRANLFNFGNSLEDIILSVILALAPFTNSVGIAYIGERQLNDLIAHRFSIEITTIRNPVLFDPDDIIP